MSALPATYPWVGVHEVLGQRDSVLLDGAALAHALGHHVHLQTTADVSSMLFLTCMLSDAEVDCWCEQQQRTVFFCVSVAVMPVLSPSVKASSMSLSSMVCTIHSSK